MKHASPGMFGEARVFINLSPDSKKNASDGVPVIPAAGFEPAIFTLKG